MFDEDMEPKSAYLGAMQDESVWNGQKGTIADCLTQVFMYDRLDSS